MSNGFASQFKDYRQRRGGAPESARREALRLGRESFREYCNLINPGFFKPGRAYQDELCCTLQKFYEGGLAGKDILIINMPPGFGKSYAASMFATWIYGKNIKNQVIEVSYNQTLSAQFSKTVRELICDEEIGGDANYYTVRSFFPKVRVKRGDGAVDRWSLEGYYNSYLATSFDGSITGMRGNLGIIDDPIKNAYEAASEGAKAAHWDFYKNTFSSRILPGGKQIIIQTRWATDDLAGMLLKDCPERCHVLVMRALNENNESLCEDLYPAADLLRKKRTIDAHIWDANYMQLPVDLKGAMYGAFKTYDAPPTPPAERHIAYIDTADEGADFLCLICGRVIGRYGYITDVYYTDKPMEVTEPETARRLSLGDVRECLIESNNGGRGFARNVDTRLKESGEKRCNVKWFHQSKNKHARILVNSGSVTEQILMPEGWEKRWPEFAKAVTSYQRKGKNAHDDAADALTGFVEMINGDVKGGGKAKVLDRKKFGGWF